MGRRRTAHDRSASNRAACIAPPHRNQPPSRPGLLPEGTYSPSSLPFLECAKKCWIVVRTLWLPFRQVRHSAKPLQWRIGDGSMKSDAFSMRLRLCQRYDGTSALIVHRRIVAQPPAVRRGLRNSLQRLADRRAMRVKNTHPLPVRTILKHFRVCELLPSSSLIRCADIRPEHRLEVRIVPATERLLRLLLEVREARAVCNGPVDRLPHVVEHGESCNARDRERSASCLLVQC